MRINMKKIFIFWVLWVCFWGVVTQTIYYFKSKESQEGRKNSTCVDGTVASIDSQIRREKRSSSTTNVSSQSFYYVNELYYRSLISYAFNNKKYNHYTSFSPHHPNFAVGDKIKVYLVPSDPESPRLSSDLSQYKFLKYGWIIMGIAPLFLFGPLVIAIFVLKKIIPFEKISGKMIEVIKETEKHNRNL